MAYETQSLMEELSKFLSPSRPVQSEEFLEGRIKEIEKIDSILSYGGRSVFITGNRGVGKTSLAQTAAILHTDSKYDYIYSACDPAPYGTFGKLSKDLLIKLAQLAAKFQNDKFETKNQLALVLSANPSVKFTKEWSKSTSASEIKEPEGASDVIRYLKGFGEIISKTLCIVLDELENLDHEECRSNLAHLMKQIGDQEIPFKFIFSGIGDTPTKLIGSHESTSRYYGAIQLAPLTGQAIINIIKKPMDYFGLNIPQDQLYRICTISCGYPHYPHLIGSKLLGNLLIESKKRSSREDFISALNAAVEDSHPYLMNSYNNAVLRRTSKEKYVLWAMADHRDIDQNINHIYDRYKNLQKRYPRAISNLSEMQFKRTLYSLLKSEYGTIVSKSKHKSYYKFSDPLMRGFARLAAGSENIELAKDEII